MSRPRLLTHWTGKDISGKKNVNDKAILYIERLKSILDDGFWMSIPKERLVGMPICNTQKECGIQYFYPMTCFTELRLSSVKNHVKKYGHLGIVVNREFILKRKGGPVRYVKSDNHDLAVARICLAIQKLEELKEKIGLTNKDIDIEHIRSGLTWNICFMKAMSDEQYEYINEEEWRIVADENIEKTNLIRRNQENKPPWFVPLKPGDIQIIVVKNKNIRNRIKKDPYIQKWFKKNIPPVITIKEASQF